MKLLIIVTAACSAAPTPAEKPAPPRLADAGIDAPPDAGIPAAVLNAPAWVFRYATAQRTETWTLRYSDGAALLVVEGTQTSRYVGTATDGASLAVDVATTTAKLTLDCKHEKRALGVKCNDTKAKPIDVLACYHPDFKTPMTFGASPGIEYVVDASCNGFRTIAK